jgi:hypothetical protein
MSIWQIVVLIAIGSCAVACLLGICIAIQKLAKAISAIEAVLKKMNSKLESVEAVSKENPEKPFDRHDSDFAEIEAAISSFEKLKRIDLTES